MNFASSQGSKVWQVAKRWKTACQAEFISKMSARATKEVKVVKDLLLNRIIHKIKFKKNQLTKDE
jgi:hypothetical protein